MGSKLQRQMQHIRFLEKKIRKFKLKGKSVAGLEKELSYSNGEEKRPEFKTGREADPRLKRSF
tara:strand:- start:375 stop:563 length:189 start_codon:yes stop_codon:yes gene_type:complete